MVTTEITAEGQFFQYILPLHTQISWSQDWEKSTDGYLSVLITQNLRLNECLTFLFSWALVMDHWLKTKRKWKHKARPIILQQGNRWHYKYVRYQRQITYKLLRKISLCFKDSKKNIFLNKGFTRVKGLRTTALQKGSS